ncbi:FkbM family methyltransferase [Thiomicrospira sp. ALE5]|uniref:FkbM family methyltransferase n=1 Tax=Thiomicrospira sp. ALE5 TaxID=748650 RepID=UPI0008EEB59C|nr:FkbM family methyltransferase [Thiomicrospira sp. ALE5]SFR49235.1 methyltransferase, FkbM family [Thiomicrospira sp. ALE5]
MRQYKQVMIQDRFPEDVKAIAFCEKFIKGETPRYVFGCNEWAKSIAEHIDLDGFVDDFTDSVIFYDKPVIRSSEIPPTAMVISAVVIARPITAMRVLDRKGIQAINYYAFKKYSGINVKDVTVLGTFDNEFRINKHEFEWVFNQFADEESRRIFSALLNFRLSRNLSFMKGFVDAQDRQYFERFLKLQPQNEVFLDVGCFDGYTSEEFIKRCPGYKAVHVFEPEPLNMARVKNRLEQYNNIHYHPYGASNQAQTLRFSSGGSSSTISEDGEMEIKVDQIDELVKVRFTFLKMDIEGAEVAALEGAERSIKLYHPRLAICAYHKADDLWRIPKLVLSFRDDYELYLRHYTEGVHETVMFFIPKE